jgi:hypothetical protein
VAVYPKIWQHLVLNQNVLDIGAHIGIVTAYCLMMGAKYVCAIEGSKKNCKHLKTTFGNIENVAIHEVALSNKTEYLNINDNVGSGINLASLETKIIQLDRSTSISELDIVSSVLAYPNPAQNELNIDIKGVNLNKTYQVTIYNLLGELKMKETVKAHQNNVLNIEELNAGVYFIKTDSGNTIKFVKN